MTNAPVHFLFTRLTKGRAKARQRKMHQIAQLLELPGSVGPGCPSPPSLNLHSLRKEAAAQSESSWSMLYGMVPPPARARDKRTTGLGRFFFSRMGGSLSVVVPGRWRSLNNSITMQSSELILLQQGRGGLSFTTLHAISFC